MLHEKNGRTGGLRLAVCISEGVTMAPIDLKALVGRFNDHTRRALEAAAGLTLPRSHYNVGIEHWLYKLAAGTATDLAAILRHSQAHPGGLPPDLTRGTDPR